MFKLERRSEVSHVASIASPFVALFITLFASAVLFAALGKSPSYGLALFFWEPIKNVAAIAELSLKATPLLLIALGLSVCFRANVWNIGAEGQFVFGAIAAGGVAIHLEETSSRGSVLVVILAGIFGGMAWAAVTALFRDVFRTSEILVSLMLVYVAELVLSYLVHGPWKDPQGYNFPQSVTFVAAARIPTLGDTRANAGAIVAVAFALVAWLFLTRSFAGFQLRVAGLSPAAASYAGFSSRRALWTALLVSGAAAGLAGALEVTGPVGQLTPYIPVGYGFAAIIVAFVGRLHPLGVVLSSILMSMLYIGGELAQSRLGLPKALTGVLQGWLLFALLACDGLTRYRLVLASNYAQTAKAS
jgi:simple sugar transport system permease protein